MAIEASIRGDSCRLVVRVERYEFPEETAGSDANWLDGEVELTVASTGSYRAREAVALTTDELESFRDQLRSLAAGGTGEATLRFEGVETDSALVREALSEFDALVGAFPVRGARHDV